MNQEMLSAQSTEKKGNPAEGAELPLKFMSAGNNP